MNLVIKSITGQTFIINTHITESVIDIKHTLSNKYNLPLYEINLIYNEITLFDLHLLDYYNIQDNDTLYLTLNIKGGFLLVLGGIMMVTMIVGTFVQAAADRDSLEDKCKEAIRIKDEINDILDWLVGSICKSKDAQTCNSTIDGKDDNGVEVNCVWNGTTCNSPRGTDIGIIDKIDNNVDIIDDIKSKTEERITNINAEMNAMVEKQKDDNDNKKYLYTFIASILIILFIIKYFNK